MQELRETIQEMMKTDEKNIEEILNRRPTGHYWIVIHHKPIPYNRVRMKSGEQVLMRVVKDYDKKPSCQLGTVVLEVRDAEIIGHKINLHDAPIDWERLSPHLGQTADPFVQKRPDLKGAYIYNN